MKIGFAQINTTVGDLAGNLAQQVSLGQDAGQLALAVQDQHVADVLLPHLPDGVGERSVMADSRRSGRAAPESL